MNTNLLTEQSANIIVLFLHNRLILQLTEKYV